MDRPGFDDAKFFLGEEVEKTPAFGMPTLFVVGLQDTDHITEQLARELDVKHIFFGANDSYHPGSADQIEIWETTIQHFLERGYWCSLDIPMRYVADFHEGGLCEYPRFIPIIKMPIPYISLWPYNTCIKIDDSNFAKSNPGVWVHNLHELMARDRFTDWSRYEKDKQS